jgi:hypothetical protein
MDSTERLEDHQPGILHKLIQTGDQEEIVVQNFGAFRELLPSRLEVKRDVQVLEKLRDRILVCVGFLRKNRME